MENFLKLSLNVSTKRIESVKPVSRFFRFQNINREVSVYSIVSGGNRGTKCATEWGFHCHITDKQGPDFDDMSSFFLYAVNVAFNY
jgi:hypothetical protein